MNRMCIVELRERSEELCCSVGYCVHPLQTIINKIDAERLGLNLGNPPVASTVEIFGSIIYKDSIISEYANTRHTISVSVVNFDGFGDEDGENIFLYVSNFFLRYYGLLEEETMLFKQTFCLPLEKVVFGAKTDESFAWMKDEKWTRHLLLSVCKKKVFCRVGDIPLITLPLPLDEQEKHKNLLLLDVVVLECHPVAQGVLAVDTVVVITKINQNKTTEIKHEQNTLIEKFPVSSHALSYLHLVNYTTKLILPITRHHSTVAFNPVLRSYAATSTILKSVWNKFKIEIMPKPLGTVVSMKTRTRVEHSDSLNQILLSREDIQALGLEIGNWVKIKLIPAYKKRKWRRSVSSDFTKSDKYIFSEDEDRIHSLPSGMTEVKNKIRMAVVSCALPLEKRQTIESSPEPTEHTVYLSPLLWFNLNQHPSDFLQSETCLLVEDVTSQISSKNFDIPYAKEVYLSLVQSPHYNATIITDVLLHEYFKTPRYVCLRDILTISAQDDPTFHQKLDDPLFIRCPVIYFYVSVIDGPPSPFGYLVDKEHCRLYQSGTVQSYIPVTMETFFTPIHFHPIWNAPLTPGLKYYVEELLHIIKPFLKSHNSRKQVSSNILLTGGVCCGKTTVVKALCCCLNLHLYQVDCNELNGDSVGSTEARLNNTLMKATMYAPCILLLKNIYMIGKEAVGEDPRIINTFSEALRNLNANSGEWPVITIATNIYDKQLNSELMSTFLHQISIKPFGEEERVEVLRALLSPYLIANNVSVVYLAQRTAGFELGDLSLLVSQAVRKMYIRLKQTIAKYNLTFEEENEICHSGMLVLQQDLLIALEDLHVAHAQSIGAPKVPDVHWEDIGGLGEVKQEILDTIQLPLQQPELLATGLRRSGVLLYGPPGTGKTLLAKAVATECSLNFLSVKGPELINMYVGQSEENVREVFHRARSAVPCIIFFDELDSLAPNRGRSGDSGGVMDRVVSQLLAELDGLNKSAEVFVIGATNRPDLIDPALLRPGRFDRLLYVGIPEDKESRVKIMKALTKKFCLSDDFSIEDVVDKCPHGLTGADFYSLCSRALKNSLGRNVQLLEQGLVKVGDAKVVVCAEDFEVAMKSLIPSVSSADLSKFLQIKASINT